jgi:hypothetical protein
MVKERSGKATERREREGDLVFHLDDKDGHLLLHMEQTKAGRVGSQQLAPCTRA